MPTSTTGSAVKRSRRCYTLGAPPVHGSRPKASVSVPRGRAPGRGGGPLGRRHGQDPGRCLTPGRCNATPRGLPRSAVRQTSNINARPFVSSTKLRDASREPEDQIDAQQFMFRITTKSGSPAQRPFNTTTSPGRASLDHAPRSPLRPLSERTPQRFHRGRSTFPAFAQRTWRSAARPRAP